MGQATSVVSQSASPPYSHPVRSKGASAMITRFAGTTATRSRAVAHNGIVYAVATAKNKSAPLYEQTLDALAEIDRSLADAGSHKSRILRTTVYITDMSRKPDMDRAWDQWVDPANSAAARLHRRHAGRTGSGRDLGHRGPVTRAVEAPGHATARHLTPAATLVASATLFPGGRLGAAPCLSLPRPPPGHRRLRAPAVRRLRRSRAQ